MSVRNLTVTIAADPPARLDKALARDVPPEAALSRSRLARLISEGAVAREGEVLSDPRAKVTAGETLILTIEQAAETATQPEDIPLRVLFEDDDLIIIDKPAGMVVHPAPGSAKGTLVNALLHHCGDSLSGIGGTRRPGIVHRLDKDTSGVLVAAKSDRAHHGLAEQFESRRVSRQYLAVVHGCPDAADPRLRGVRGASFEGATLKITTQLARHRTDRQRQAVTFHGGRHAVTRVRVMECFGAPAAAALVECWLETGRTHQIRAHLAHCGHALIGDPVYGGRRQLSRKALGHTVVDVAAAFSRQALHAASLGFFHPISEEWLEFSTPPPAEMEDLIVALRRSSGVKSP